MRALPGQAATRPALVAVAHGTRHPAGPATVDRLLDGVRCRLPGVQVAGAYVDLVQPGVGEVLAGLRRPAVVVPLLLSVGYHVRTDLPAAMAEASAPVTLAAPLGPSAALTTALLDRVRQAGAVSGDPVVLGAAGSSDPAAVAAVRRAGGLLARSWRGPVTCGFLSLATPDLGAALDRAVRRTTRRVTVAPYLLSPGRFAVDLAGLADERGVRSAAVLGDHPALMDLVIRRYLAHAAAPSPAQVG